jgi:hypothetical protein
MQVEAIYDDGRLEFIHPLQLKHAKLRLMVTVPDEEIVSTDNPYNQPAEVLERAKAMLERMEAIRNAPLPLDDEIQELTEKQLERIEAFDLRDEIKAMR